MKITRFTSENKKSTVTASDSVFAQPVNMTLISQAVRVYMANKRQGTSKVQTRAEVTLTKRKWFKQKGTGNARHGAQSAPIFVGGGVAHGPKGVENWSLQLSQKMKRSALISALSAQAQNIVVVDGLESLQGKTKEAAQLVAQVANPDKDKVLVLVDSTQVEMIRSLKNLAGVSLARWQDINAYDVASVDTILMTADVLKKVEARFEKKS